MWCGTVWRTHLPGCMEAAPVSANGGRTCLCRGCTCQNAGRPYHCFEHTLVCKEDAVLLWRTHTVLYTCHCSIYGERTYQHALQTTNTENSKQIFPEKELSGHRHNFHILCERFIYSHDRSAYFAAGNKWSVDRSWIYVNLLQTH